MGCNAFESCREASAKQLIHMSTGSKTKIYVESTAAVDLRKHPAGHPVAGHCYALSNPNIHGRTRTNNISIKTVWWLLSPNAALSYRCLSGLRWIHVNRLDSVIHVHLKTHLDPGDPILDNRLACPGVCHAANIIPNHF